MCRFYQKMVGNGLFCLKNGWVWFPFFDKWVGVGRFCQEMDGSGLFFLRNG